MGRPPIRVQMPVIKAGDIRAREDRVVNLAKIAQLPFNPVALEEEEGPPGESIWDGFRRAARVANRIFNPLFAAKENTESINAARAEGAGRLQSLVAGFQDEIKLLDQFALAVEPAGEALGAGIDVAAEKIQSGAHAVLGTVLPEKLNPFIVELAKPESRRTLGQIQDIFTGDLEPAELAGLLRSKFKERGWRSQLFLGALTDPTILLTPAGVARVGSKAGSIFGRRAAGQVDAAVRREFGRSLDELLPIAGGMSADDAAEFSTRLGDVVFGAIDDVGVTRRFSQAGGEQVIRQREATDSLMTTLQSRGDVASLQDRAILSLARATGMRIGRITGLSWDRLNQGMVRGDLIEAAARGRAKEVGDATGAIRIPEPDLPAVQRAIADYKTATILEGGATEGSELAFARGIKAGKTPASERARDAFDLRFKKYQTETPGLPTQTRLYRHLFAKEAHIRGTPIEAISRQLAHGDVSTTQRFYLRELGINLTETDDELLEALSGLAPDLVDDAMKFSRELKTTPGGLRKGTAIGKGEQAITVGEIGRRAEQQVGISGNDATILQKLEGETASFYDRSSRLFALKRVVQRLDRMKGTLDAQKQSIKDGLSFKRSANEVEDLGGLSGAERAELTKSLKEQQAVLNGKEKARAAYVKILVQHIEREAGDTLFNMRKAAEAGRISADQANMLEDAILRVEVLAGEKAAEKSLRFKIVAKERAKIKRTSLIEARAGAALSKLKPGEVGSKAIRDWVDNSTVLKTLDERGMHQSLTEAGIRRVLNKLKRFPEALGDDFGQLLETNPAAAQQRIEQIAATMADDHDLMRRFQYRATNAERKAASLEDSVGTGGKQPPREPPERLTELGDELDPSFDAGQVVDLEEHILPLISTSTKAQAASRFVGRLAGQGARSVFESAVGTVSGTAMFLLDGPKIDLARLASYDVFTNFGRRVSEAYTIRLTKAGGAFDIAPNFRKPGEGGSYMRFTKETLQVKPGQIDPTLRKSTRATWSEEQMADHMREYEYFYTLSPEQARQRYVFKSDEVYDALMSPHVVVAAMDRLVEEAAVKYGFDISKFLPEGRRLDVYVPRMVGSIADVEKMRAPVTDGIRQAQPSFFLERQLTTWEAVNNGVQYVPGPDALGLYIQNMHMLISEHQLTNLVQKTADVLPLHAQNTLQRAARGLGRVRDDLTRPQGPDDWVEHNKARELARRYFPELTQRVLDNPAGLAKQELDDFIKRAVDDHRTTLSLKINQFGPDFWKNETIWTAEAYSQVRKLTLPSENYLVKVAGGVSGVNQTLRFAKTGFDFGAPLIHGFPVLFENPKVWTRGVGHQFAAFNDPAVHRAYLNSAENAPIVRELQLGGSKIGTKGEPFEFLNTQNLKIMGVKLFKGDPLEQQAAGVAELGTGFAGLKRLPERARLGGLPRLIEKFEAAFAGFQDFVQLELYKAMRRDGMSLTERGDLIASINKMTGTLNATLAGTTPTVRILQTSVFFAATYRKAAYGLIIDAGKGGIRGQNARKALGSMMLAGGFAMWFLGTLSGNDQVLDPTSPKFMTVKLGDFNVGIGTAYYSLIRLGMSLTEVATGRDLVVDKDGTSFKEDPRAWNRWTTWSDNQLFRWFRAQASPVASHAADFTLGRTFLGESLRDENGPDWAKTVKRFPNELVPFWFDTEMHPSWLGGKGLSGGLFAAGGEMSGLRSFPLSLVQRSFNVKEAALLASQDPDIVAWRADRAAAGKEASWRAAPVTFKQRLTENNPEVLEMDRQLKEADLERGDQTQKDFIVFREGSQTNRDILKTDFANLATSWDTGLLTDRQFRDKRSEVLTKHQTRVIDLQDRFEAVMAKFEESRLNRDDDAFIGDLAFDKYVIEVLNHPDTTDDLGNFQPDVFARVKDKWRDENLRNENTWDYIQSRLRTKQDLPDVLQEFEDDKESLGAYWDIHHTAMTAEEAQIIEMYLSRGDNINQSLFENSHPKIKAAVKKWRALRVKLRQQQPNLDWLLAKWYGLKPSTPSALARFNQRQATWGRAPIRG